MNEPSTRLGFRPHTRLDDETDSIIVRNDLVSFALRRAGAKLRQFLGDLAAPCGIAATDPRAQDFATVVERLERLIEYRVHDRGGGLSLIVQTMVAGTRYRPAALPVDAVVRLSRFALLRADEDGLLLESALSVQTVRPHNRLAAAVIASIATATTVPSLAHSLAVPEAEVSYLVGHLAGAGMVDLELPDGFAEEQVPLNHWEFHDLLFHSRSRLGRHDRPVGGVFPFGGNDNPEPVLRPLTGGRAITLARPSLSKVLAADRGLTTAIEGRRSTRTYGERPLSIDQLGELLYRTARVRAVMAADPAQGKRYSASTRPYPSGGATYDLEFYLTVNRVEGAEQAIYRYDPMGHRLEEIDRDPRPRTALLDTASNTLGGGATPDVLITLTSRFQRLSWKYRSMAYAATLKNVGCVFQTMYLVAADMGIAACALGAGDADSATQAFRLNYLCESSVGEFALGSMPSDPPQRHAYVPGNDLEWRDSAVQRLNTK